jgi:hypothetical protein
MLKQALVAVTATVIIAASAQAANNPLHPSYYQAKAAVEIKASGAERYVDSRNPLKAAYTRTGEAKWMTTSDQNVVAYVDVRNPLSPSYKR